MTQQRKGSAYLFVQNLCVQDGLPLTPPVTESARPQQVWTDFKFYCFISDRETWRNLAGCLRLNPGISVTLMWVFTGRRGWNWQEAGFCRSSPGMEVGGEEQRWVGGGNSWRWDHTLPAFHMMTGKTCRWVIECVKCVHAHCVRS